MKKAAAFFALLLQVLVLSAVAAEPARECTLCAGAVSDLAAPPPVTVPLLVEVRQDDLATAAARLDALSPEQRKKVALIVSYAVNRDSDALLDVEQHTKSIVEWARIRGPFDALGVRVSNADAPLVAYAVKRLAVTAQGLDVAGRIVLTQTPDLDALFENGVQPYFDALLTDGAGVTNSVAWLAERDPSKKVFAVVAPQSPNHFYDLARAFADGATRAYLATSADPVALANFNQTFAGDWAYDSTAKIPVLDAK
ncbi:MAG TPA: hypothetical protein VF698_06515, partial [Thermoanaerobaculia bacterium]